MTTYIQFGPVSTKEMPAREGRSASTMTVQDAYLTQPANDEVPFDLRTPFQVTIRDDEQPYEVGPKYGFSYQHFTVGKYGRLEFQPYARFELLDQADKVATPLKAPKAV